MEECVWAGGRPAWRLLQGAAERRGRLKGGGGEESSRASQSAPEFRLGQDEERGLVGHPEGGAQEAAGSIGLELGEKPGLETKLVWGITVEWCWKASACGRVHPGKVRGRPRGAHMLQEEDPRGDREAERVEGQVTGT